MSLSGISLPHSLIGSQSLEQVISTTQQQLPIKCQFDDEEFLFETTIELGISSLETSISAISNDFLSPATVSTELVVFSTITWAQLYACLQAADLTCVALNAINIRNNLTSYRFNVVTNNVTQSRQTIAQFAKRNAIEAALIVNAPLLTQPGVLVMDMDSTTIEIECIDEIAALAGVGEQVAEVTEMAMLGQLDFAQSLHQRVATLAGAPESILQQVIDNIPLMPGLTTLVEHLKHHGWKIAIASGGFTYFADYLKSQLSLDAARANILEISDGKLTGKVLGDVVDAQVKADTLIALQQSYKLPSTQTVAMGDGANDLTMMNAAQLGVAFHAKPIVTAKADCAITHHGLDILLHWLK